MSSRNTKPTTNIGLDTTHSLYSSLKGAFAFNEGSGQFYDAVTNAATSLSSGTTWTAGGITQVNYTSGPISLPSINLGTAYSVILFTKLPSVLDYGFLLSGNVGVTARFGTGGLFGFYSTSTHSSTGTLTTGSILALGLARDSVDDKSYINGGAPVTVAQYSNPSMPIVPIIGDTYNSAAQEISCLLFFNKKLSDAEMLSISTNPWQLWQVDPYIVDPTREYSTVNGVYGGNGTTTGTTLNKPANTANGDLLLAAVYVMAGSDSITTPDGWNVLSDQFIDTRTRLQVCWKIANNEPVSWEWIHSYNLSYSFVKRITGAYTVNPITITPSVFIDVYTGVPGATCPSITTDTDNALICQITTLEQYSTFDTHALQQQFTIPTIITFDAEIQSVKGATGTKFVGVSSYDRIISVLFAINSEAADQTAPTITTFTPPNISNSTTISGISITASDVVGVTDWLITEVDTPDVIIPLATDNFTGSLGSNWVTQSGSNTLAIVSGSITGSVNNSDNTMYYNITVTSDQYSQITITDATNMDGGPTVRIASGTGYFLADDTGNYTLYRVGTPVVTLMSGLPIVGDVIKLQAIGDTITVFRNGVQLGSSYIDPSPILLGHPGIFQWNNTTKFDNFECGSVNWTAITPTTSFSSTTLSYNAGTAGSKTLYAWVKDAAGNVSAVDTPKYVLVYTGTADSTAPTISQFTAGTVTDQTVAINSFEVAP